MPRAVNGFQAIDKLYTQYDDVHNKTGIQQFNSLPFLLFKFYT